MFSITRVFFFILQITVFLESFVVGVTQAGIKNNPNNHEKFGTHQKFAMEPQDQTAVVGSRVTLPCRVVAKSGQLQWTKDDFGLGDHRFVIQIILNFILNSYWISLELLLDLNAILWSVVMMKGIIHWIFSLLCLTTMLSINVKLDQVEVSA